ncbi:MAG: xanthine dehydrogenase family protein subunit M [Proteobacteria bacterium]|nr:xanthine dehydrogenase family protein subunit M [Pseudomonadota bacterium]
MPYLRPTSCDEALRHLAQRGFIVLAGGTDHFPAQVGRPPASDVLDITAIKELRGIMTTDGGWRIGATTSWTTLLETSLPPLFDGLKQAAREVGGVQIQNAGTVAGNLCNASPAADGVPPLLALDAQVELLSAQGARTLPLAAFITGPRQTARRGDELVGAILIPRPPHTAASRFLKFGARRYLVISIAMVSAVVTHQAGIVRTARVAVGSCSPVARRLPTLEAALVGAPFSVGLGARAQAEHLQGLSPIDDVRGDAAFRRDTALVLVRRCLSELVEAARA